MSEDFRRTIDELATLYENEPEMRDRDIYVEGTNDSTLLEWYFKGKTKHRVFIYEVNSIDIPTTLLEKYKLDDGNRGRVLALAIELSNKLKSIPQNCFTVVYDRDFEDLEKTPKIPINAVITDFSCIEMYLFNADTIEKFVSLALMKPDISAIASIDSLAEVLVRLWVIKAANHLLGYGMSWVSFVKNCSLDGSKIVFDEDEFIKKYLMKNGRLSDATTFQKKIDEVKNKLATDSRFNINGHHFYELAYWYFRKIAKEKGVMHNKNSFERSLCTCLERSGLDHYLLFQTLLARCKTQ